MHIMDMHTHTHTYIYIHTYIYKNIYIHTYIYKKKFPPRLGVLASFAAFAALNFELGVAPLNPKKQCHAAARA